MTQRHRDEGFDKLSPNGHCAWLRKDMRGFDTSARTERRDEGFDKLSPNGVSRERCAKPVRPEPVFPIVLSLSKEGS